MRLKYLSKKEIFFIIKDFEKFFSIFLLCYQMKVEDMKIDEATLLFKNFLQDYSKIFLQVIKQSINNLKKKNKCSKALSKKIIQLDELLFAIGSIYYRNEFKQFFKKNKLKNFLSKHTIQISSEELENFFNYLTNKNFKEFYNLTFFPIFRIILMANSKIRLENKIPRWCPIVMKNSKISYSSEEFINNVSILKEHVDLNTFICLKSIFFKIFNLYSNSKSNFNTKFTFKIKDAIELEECHNFKLKVLQLKKERKLNNNDNILIKQEDCPIFAKKQISNILYNIFIDLNISLS